MNIIFSLKVYLEDKDTSSGHIILKVKQSDTIGDLKQRVSWLSLQNNGYLFDFVWLLALLKQYLSVYRTLVKSADQKNNFLISQPKHMLWVLKRTVSMRRFF